MAVRLFAFFVSDLAVRKRAGPDLTCETLHTGDWELGIGHGARLSRVDR